MEDHPLEVHPAFIEHDDGLIEEEVQIDLPPPAPIAPHVVEQQPFEIHLNHPVIHQELGKLVLKPLG